MNRPPEIASPARSIAMWMLCGDAKNSLMPSGLARRDDRRRGPREIEREQAQQDAGDKRRQENDAPMRQPCRETRADRHRDREDRQEDGDDALAAANVEGHERRQQRQHQRANEPEPARHHGAPPQSRLAADIFDERAGRGENIAPDHQVWRALAGRRNEPAGDPACHRRHNHQPGEMDGVAAILRRDAGDDGADENGKKGPALDQRIAGRQFGALEMVGQDAVFDRSEQRSDRPVQSDRDKQQNDRVDGEAHHRQHGNGDLEQLQALRHQSFVVAVGKFAAEARKQKERKDQRCAGKRDQCPGIGAADLEQNEKDQRGLEKIVAERREELAPEQGRETSRRHQGRGHGSSAVINGSTIYGSALAPAPF